ncbi:hypothetical protein DY000_02024498 [Brassica cretica]|uniref:Uncharacterized protein n=1 Tax=Brassica cretica TaxID=69181 RepID=A0ABQ7E0U1_BRACR|nr:hypothetical protein DY000_02024498 [Brassica cretica]
MSQFPSSTKTIRRHICCPFSGLSLRTKRFFLPWKKLRLKKRQARRESLHRKKLRVIEEEDGDGNSNTGSCTDHIPEINIILLPAKTETHKKNMIQVSNTKKPLFFYVNLAPSLHTAITMVVTISEILKNIGLTTKKKMKNEAKGKMIEIVLGKSDKFDSLVPPVTNGKTP